MNFTYEALTADGRSVSATLEAASEREAVEQIRGRGMLLTRLHAASSARPRSHGEQSWVGRTVGDRHVAGFFGQGAPSTAAAPVRQHPAGRGRSRELLVFTRQMRMLLDAGAGVVPALEAIEAQTVRPAFRNVVRQIREHVETGGHLSEALSRHPMVFKPVYASMVASGEATGTLSEAFARLHDLAARQERATRAVIGAMIYPAMLALMCAGAVATLVLFVVPRFRILFDSISMPLPFYTQVMFEVSAAFQEHWMVLLGGVLAVGAAGFVAARAPLLRGQVDALLPRLPLIGPMYSRLVLARVLRIWASMLRSHVPLLETIRHSHSATRNARLLATLEDIEERVAGGGRMGRALAESGWAEPVVASAIAIGEENGRLAESVEFVSSWIDEDNDRMIAAATRIVEPLILALMGLIVGSVALSLFMPLFDMATAGR